MLLTTLCASAVLAFLYHFILHPLLFSPLRRIPSAHPLARFTSLWILYIRFTEWEIRTVHAAHVNYGPIILLGPNEISVNCVDGGIRNVYAGNFEKDSYYEFFSNFGAFNMFSMIAHGPHSVRKRIVSHVYSKSFIQTSPTMAAIEKILLYERLLPLLRSRAGNALDAYLLFNTAALDAITGYVFGVRSATARLSNPEAHQEWMDKYFMRMPYRYYEQDIPHFTSPLKKIGLNFVPKSVYEANDAIEKWCFGLCESASEVIEEIRGGKDAKVEDVPVVYDKLRGALEKEQEDKDMNERWSSNNGRSSEASISLQLQVASEVWDHTGMPNEAIPRTLNLTLCSCRF